MGPPPPSSAYFDRMGYGIPPYGRGGGGGGFGESIAPTPLQRRRDRPGGDQSVPGPSPAAGYPTPYSTQRPQGNEYGGSQGEMMATPAQPAFEGREAPGSAYPTPQSPMEGSPGGDEQQQQYEFPNNFPFYQESNRTWHCKYCSHIPPQYRDPQSIWSSPHGSPPPGQFIDQHLSLCRAYQQGYLPGMFPMPYGGGPHMQPYGQPSSAPWEMYPPPEPTYSNMDPTGAGRFHPMGQEDPTSGMYADQRMRPSAAASSGMASRARVPRPIITTGGPSADVMSHAIKYLEDFEHEYYERDPANAEIPKLVLDEDRLLLTNYFFHLMKQLRLCRFSEADRKTRGGKREKIKIGYGGLQCIHCSDLPMSRKFFWSNVDRLANSFAEIPGHVLKCKRCPPQTKEALLQLKQAHPEEMAKLPRGSQKVFFRRMWRRLHDEDPADYDTVGSPSGGAAAGGGMGGGGVHSPLAAHATSPEKDSPASKKSTDHSPSSGQSEESTFLVQRTATEAAKALAIASKHPDPPGPPSPSSRILLAIPEDKEWLSEKDCFVRKQLEVFCATEDDVAAAQADRKYPVKVSQVGIRCVHCAIAHGSNAIGHAIAYPFSVSGIHESVREFHRLHLDSCENLPPATKAKLKTLGASSLSSVLRKYYILAAKALGLRDTRESGIRCGGESSPIGSQAAFTFADGEEEQEDAESNPAIKTECDDEDDSKMPAETKQDDSRGSKRNSPSQSDSAGDLQPQQKVAKMEI